MGTKAADALQPRIGTRRLATIAIFAAIYAVLSLIPVSRLVGNVSFLTMAEVFSPLAGMVLGPLEGGLAVLVGTFVAIALGKPVGFDGLDFIPGVIAAVTAGLAMKGDLKPAAALSVAMYAVFMADPLSSPFISVGGVPVPYLWMHMFSLVLFLSLWYLDRSRVGLVSLPLLLAAIVFYSTMNAHVAGAIMYENVLVRINQISAATVTRIWPIVFYVYPIERVFFTVVGSVLAIGFFRAIPPDTVRQLRRG